MSRRRHNGGSSSRHICWQWKIPHNRAETLLLDLTTSLRSVLHNSALESCFTVPSFCTYMTPAPADSLHVCQAFTRFTTIPTYRLENIVLKPRLHVLRKVGKPGDSSYMTRDVLLQIRGLFANSASAISTAMEKQNESQEDTDALAWERIQHEGQHQSIQAPLYPVLGSILNI